MRCANIRIHAEIPILAETNDGASATGSTFCDGNGVVYSVEAVRKACENIGNLPIIQYDEHGAKKVVGIVKSIKWNPEGFVEVNGFLRFGGTCEDVIFDKTETVIEMKITEIGLGT